MDDHIEPSAQAAEGEAYWWAIRATAVSLGVVAVLGAAVAGMVSGAPGVWGAVTGAALAALAALVTQGAMVWGYRRAPQIFAAIVGGSWLAKMVVIVVGMLLLSRVSTIDRPSFGVVAVVGIVVTLGIDVLAVRKARIPYTTARSTSQDA